MVTFDLIVHEDPEQPGGQEAELPLTGVRQRGNHLSQGGLPANAGQAVIVGEQEPERKEGKNVRFLTQIKWILLQIK